MNFGIEHTGVMNVSECSVSQVNQALATIKARGGEAWIDGNHVEGFFMNVRVRVYGILSEGTHG